MLPTISVGDPIRAVHLQQIIAEIRQNAVRPGVGLRMTQSSNGTMLSVDETGRRGGGGGGEASEELKYTPFRVVIGYPEDPAFPVVRVQGESYFCSIETGELITIGGDLPLGAILGSAQDNADDPGQFSLPEIGESIWLECDVDGLTIASATLKEGDPTAEGWTNYPDPIETAGNDPFTVTKSRVLIAHVVDGEDPRHGDTYSVGTGETPEKRKVLQQLRTNVGAQVLMMRGITAPVIVPWHGPFIIA